MYTILCLCHDGIPILEVLCTDVLQVLGKPTHVRDALIKVGVGIARAPYEVIQRSDVPLSLLWRMEKVAH